MTSLTEAVEVQAGTPATRLGAFAEALAAESHHTLVLRLTLILVILHGATTPFLSVVVRIMGLLMLVLPQFMHQARVWWWVLAGLLVVSNAEQWYLIDNHQYLMTYWVLACALTLQRPDDLRDNARLLIAIAFGFAVVWKIAAGQYFDGGFFYYMLITDPRLQSVAGVLVDGGLDLVRQTDDAINTLARYGDPGTALSIVRDSRLMALAVALSIVGLVVESAVAVSHALPGRQWYLLRHATLIMFAASTYFLLPVTGFAFLLGVMGFAQADEQDGRLKQVYLVVLCIIQLTLIPWRHLLAPSVS